MTALRVRLSGVATAMLLATVVASVVAPAEVDASLNRTLSLPPYHPSARALALHEKLVVVDLHADALLWGRDLLRRNTRGHVDVPRLLDGNVALQGFGIVTKSPSGQNIERNAADRTDRITALAVAERWPVATWTSLLARALYQASELGDAAARSGGKLAVIRTSADLQTYLHRRETEHDITAGVLGLEGAHALEGDLANVDRLFDAGVRMVGLAHFFDNDIAGSAHGAAKGGLTAKGRELVRRLEAKGMIVDLAHSSPRTIADVLAIATRPVVVSHTGVRGTCDNTRNLTDDELRGVARTGGIVGIGYWSVAVCGTDAHAIARAIRHAVSVAGIEHVALGSDFDGSVTAPFDATGVVLVTDALLDAGFADDDIAAIMGGNAVRLLLHTLP